jgi:hypothetical protein
VLPFASFPPLVKQNQILPFCFPSSFSNSKSNNINKGSASFSPLSNFIKLYQTFGSHSKPNQKFDLFPKISGVVIEKVDPSEQVT